MASVTFSPSVGGDGSTVSDDSDPSTGLQNYGWAARFIPALKQVVAVAGHAANSATTAANAASTATAQAGTATAQAGIAIAKAGEASSSAATATTKANEAAASKSAAEAAAAQASAVVTNVSVVRHSLRPSLLLAFANSERVDPRITFTRPSTATRFNRLGVLESVAVNQPRIDYDPATGECKGFLIEGQRTNAVRNPRCEGAVAGTPGTLPANWSIAIASGLSRSVVGTGVENGIEYVDIRVFGTTIATGQINIRPEAGTDAAASVGQTWTQTMFVKLVGGGLTNTDFRLAIDEAASGGAFLAGDNTPIAIGAGNLRSQRYSHTRTLSSASVAAVRNPIFTDLANGVTIDLTLRIGIPQIEQGAFATSPILPPVGTLAQSTRAADTAVVNTLNGWYNASKGTIVREIIVDETMIGTIAGCYATMLWDGTGDNRLAMRLVRDPSIPYGDTIGTTAGVSQFDTSNVQITLPAKGRLLKQTLRYGTNDIAATMNGVAISTDASASVPTVTSLVLMGANDVNAAGGGRVWIKTFAYYPGDLSGAELQGVTA